MEPTITTPATPALPPMPSTMPPEIARAILLVMRAVGKLAHNEKNEQGRYAYASIDAFLAAVNPACAEAGLVIQPIEIGVEPGEFDTTDRDGKAKKRRQLTFRYQFMLIHESGATWLNERDVRHVTVENTGPQSYGAAMAYALKQFMRALFLIPTGDQDADAQDQHSADLIRATVKAVKAKKETGESQILMDFGQGIEPVAAADVAARVLSHLTTLGEPKAAKEWWDGNKVGREQFHNEFPKLALDLKRKVESFLTANPNQQAAE